MKKLLYILLMIPMLSIAQDKVNPDEILERVLDKHENIISFSADLEVELDVSFINMPNKTAKVFYKAPDKFTIKSDSFVMLPKKGIKFSIDDYLNKEYSSIYLKIEKIDNKDCHMIKIVPLTSDSEFVLLTLWIDVDDDVVIKMESTTVKMGTYSVGFFYGNNDYWLPERQEVEFMLEKFKIPIKFNGKIKIDTDLEEKETKGKVIVKYTNYNVNIILDDDVFEELLEDDTKYQ